jgi:hypothetical protein
MIKWLLVTTTLLGACMVGDEGDFTDDLNLGAFAAAARFTVVQHNLEKKNGPLDAALQAGKSADGITLQEVCPDQLATLRAKAAANGWTLASAEVPHATCNNQNPSVVAIWTGGANGEVSRVDQLGTTAAVPGQAACVAFTFKKVKTHLCSVKLISTAQPEGQAELIRRTQTAQLRAIARNTWFGGRDELGIIAGDFNANPDQQSVDALYAPQIGGNGDFTEYNRGNGNTRDGRPTAHATGDNGPYAKKIDYVFFSTNRVAVNGPAVAITATGSDHDMVVSSAMVKK